MDGFSRAFFPRALGGNRGKPTKIADRRSASIVGKACLIGKIAKMLTTDFSAPDEFFGNPIDVIEQLAAGREWMFDRRSDEEVAIEAPGQWCSYSLYFAWSDDLKALHFSCAFDMRVANQHRSRIYELLAHLNERLWLGHFALWMEEGVPMFRHTVQVADLSGSRPLLEELIEVAVTECDRFFPAFQFVVWGGKSASEAMQAAMFETVGEA